MKKIFITITLLFPLFAFGQWGGIIHKIGGGGTSTADGIPATSAVIDGSVVGIDAAGNVYVSGPGCVRKIEVLTGLIHTVAGNGSSSAVPPSGDGGAATAADLGWVNSISLDHAGNIYIVIVGYYGCIRKVDATTGIITTVLSPGATGQIVFDATNNLYITGANGSATIKKFDIATGLLTLVAGSDTATVTGGDGGPATAASFYLSGFAQTQLDPSGNIYISTEVGNTTIRKIDIATGIIDRIAGNNAAGCTGDGGPATSASLNASNFAIDATGNIIIFGNNTFAGCNVTRMIEANSGIISTIHTIGSNNPVSGASINGTTLLPSGMYDRTQHLYFIDNGILWKMDPAIPGYTADSFGVYVHSNCTGTRFSISTASYHTGMSITTYFGDGTSSATAVTGSAIWGGSAVFAHAYSVAGDYSVKHILLNGSTAVDSITYSNHYAFCNEVSPRFYFDANNNCVNDSGIEAPLSQPVLTEIAVNGIPRDTVSCTSGFNYNAYGNPGDVVSMRILSLPLGVVASCQASGIFYDTLQVGTLTQPHSNFAVNCTAASGFDLQEAAMAHAGAHLFETNVLVSNTYCTPYNGVLTMTVSPKYNFVSAYPAPSSVVGQTVTWNMASIFAGEAARYIHASFEKPDSLPSYLPGDTLISTYNIDPTTGDAIPSSNYSVRIDTVKSGFDPNYITVTPEGYIPSSTLLQYGIGFENTGNDTAHNITVLDTLSEHLNMHSFRMLAASATMNISMEPYGEKTIVKFDFPNINLQDSTHHDECHGMLMYSIKAKDNLLSGTVIPNRAGIYFDTNPVVMTNTATNIIGWPLGIGTVTKENPIELYPNPATNQLTINTLQGNYTSLTITSSVGNTVMQHPIINTSTTLDIQSLPAGIYYVTVRGAAGIKAGRFVKL